MNLPSIKTLNRAFPGKGKALRRLLESAAAVREHPAAVARVAECYHPPGLSDLRLHALNAVAETYGVECVWRADGSRDTMTGRPALEYLNTGDSYAPTICRLDTGRYIVADIGYLIEKGNYD